MVPNTYATNNNTGCFPENSDVMKLQVFAAAPRESKLRARPRPPVLETA